MTDVSNAKNFYAFWVAKYKLFSKNVVFDGIKLFKIFDASLKEGISSYFPSNWDRLCAYIPHCNGEYYSNPTHEKHQWMLLLFIVLLMMDAKGVRNVYSILVVVNKHNSNRVASCWFIMYYRC